jgi:uncharacterized protein
MAILASALWRGIANRGHEACRLEKNEMGWRLLGAAVFSNALGPACLSYAVQCDTAWKTLSGEVRGALGAREVAFVIAKGERIWTLNGEPVAGLDRLDDLDLGFSPATNSLQARRATLPLGETVELPAAWLDVEAGALSELAQTYQRRSETTFWYEAPQFNYKGLLEFASNGLIRRYPGLWEEEPAP